ncbi:MAG: hypothetical protein JEZ01_16965 [Labilibaculum sp.]|nr:hypothetical protein [Labilibaculum sp.]MBI9059457.1 hypothetical protein [Labilibaculum sp.]
MMKFYLIFLLCLISLKGYAQLDSILVPDSCVQEACVMITSTPPTFPGGIEKWHCFFEENLNFNLINKIDTSARCFCSFTVDTLGKAKFDTIYRSFSTEIDQELIHLIEKMPKWTPGKIQNKLKNIPMTFRFKLPFERRCKNKSIEQKINDLQFITDMPYICRDTIGGENSIGCGDKLFWDIVIEKENAIPLLIESLIDTTKTSAIVPNLPYNYTIADIAYHALQEIIDDIPTFDLLGVEFDKNGCGYCSYWKHLSIYENRKTFKEDVKIWYAINKKNLRWIKSDKVLTGDCSFSHPNGGHYKLKKN